MIVKSLEDLKERINGLPEIPPDFFEKEFIPPSRRASRKIEEGSVVCLKRHYHHRDQTNPERTWGFVFRCYDGDAGLPLQVHWVNGYGNGYRGGELCTLEEFMSEHGNVLPFSWRN